MAILPPLGYSDSDRVKRELRILYEVSNAMRTTLKLDQIFYMILTALTSHEGLGFNRAMVFLVNEAENVIEGKMGIGPHSGEEADKIWRGIEKEHLSFDDLLNSYDIFKRDPESRLNILVKGIKIPLTEDMGILALTILEGMPFEVTTNEARKKVSPIIRNTLNTDYFITVPLKAKDKTLGAILVDNIFTKKPITKSDIRLLTMFANHAGLAIENSRLYEETEYLSKTDWLTKLWNSGELHRTLAKELEKSRITDKNLTVLMIDVDNFKPYNDSVGHRQGDEAIRKIATLLMHRSRKNDFVARYGGEEFTIIMPDTTKKTALAIAERLKKEVEDKWAAGELPPGVPPLTISIGISTFPVDAADKDNLIHKADIALYEAKSRGKNKVCVYTPHLGKGLFGFKKKS
ncbi:MAG: sensor domain-containing diguanylate cyclase [Candidatus Omnitrophota bacterium]|nr:MAG: sensor domain-containing diguanylate cyclase [Candidatus Omnitrophota bacterium]